MKWVASVFLSTASQPETLHPPTHTNSQAHALHRTDAGTKKCTKPNWTCMPVIIIIIIIITIIIIIIIVIDVAIPAGRNVTQKNAEKELKCKSLCTKIQRMCNMTCMIIPGTTGASGIVTTNIKNLGSHTRKTWNRFTTNDSYTWNIKRNTESPAVWNLKSKWWGSSVIQEGKYRGLKGLWKDK